MLKEGHNAQGCGARQKEEVGKKNTLFCVTSLMNVAFSFTGFFDGIHLKKCPYDYWTEDKQLSWLTGAYLVGELHLACLDCH